MVRTLKEINDAWKNHYENLEWWDIPGYSLYEINAEGVVRNKHTKSLIEIKSIGGNKKHVVLQSSPPERQRKSVSIMNLIRKSIPMENRISKRVENGEDENFRVIPGLERYEIDRNGRVRGRSLKRFLTIRKRSDGSSYVCVIVNNENSYRMYKDISELLEDTWGEDD